jgi:hypothetical protein
MEKVIKLIPAITGGLIFLGFLNYSFYYGCFGIDITSFLTTGELLLSFLKLTIPMLIICAIISLYIIGPIVNIILFNESIKDKEEKADKPLFINEHWKMFIKECKERGFRKFLDYVITIFDLIELIKVLAIQIFLLGFPILFYHTIVSDKPYLINTQLIIALSILWFLMLTLALARLQERRGVNYRGIAILFLSALFISLIYISNRQNATNILKGNPEYNVSVFLNNDTIVTDSIRVYIGKTDKFVFIRNLDKKRNEIFSVSNIVRLDISKN